MAHFDVAYQWPYWIHSAEIGFRIEIPAHATICPNQPFVRFPEHPQIAAAFAASVTGEAPVILEPSTRIVIPAWLLHSVRLSETYDGVNFTVAEAGCQSPDPWLDCALSFYPGDSGRAVLAAQMPRAHAGFGLAQNPDDLIFSESTSFIAALHNQER